MQLFGRSNRAGGEIDSKSLRWSFSSFKGDPILYATENMARIKFNSKKSRVSWLDTDTAILVAQGSFTNTEEGVRGTCPAPPGLQNYVNNK